MTGIGPQFGGTFVYELPQSAEWQMREKPLMVESVDRWLRDAEEVAPFEPFRKALPGGLLVNIPAQYNTLMMNLAKVFGVPYWYDHRDYWENPAALEADAAGFLKSNQLQPQGTEPIPAENWV